MTATELSRVAVVGLGQMGRGIARCFDAAGLLRGAWDTDSDAVAAAELSQRVQTAPLDVLTDDADILLFAVRSTGEIEQALTGASRTPGAIVVDLTTSHPDDSRTLAAALGAGGIGYLDAAMTGGAAGADNGTLTLMIGGSETDLDRCRPALDVISEQIFHLGPVGAGHTMKLVHNMILHSSFLATCEGLRLAERAGLDVDKAVDVLNAGNARSFVTQVRFPRDILSGTMMARSHIANLEKDLGLAHAFAASLNARIPFGSMTHRLLAHALANGHGAADFSWLYPLYDTLVETAEDVDT